VLVAQWLYTRHRVWIPIITPVVGALLMNHVAAVTYQALFEQREKRRVKGVFSKVVSPDVVNELLGTDKLNLDGARRRITVFFADVRGFTTLTDQNQSEADDYVRTHKLEGEAAERYYDERARDTLNTVNLYLATIADQIKKHKGTLDKYIGDCVMAFWGAPVDNPHHAVSCVRAAIDAQRAMDAVNQERGRENVRREAENKLRAERGEPPLPMLGQLALGTGINTGTVIVGLMGSTSHILNYTVFGREVNIASRLEGVSGRGRIIIGEATYEDIRRDDAELAATCVELEPVTVKGINKPVRIFEVPWKTPAPASPAA
jgi:adenylate cyclase